MSLKKWALVAALALSVTSASAEVKTLRVGVTIGSDSQIWEFLKERAKEKDLNIEIVEFADYVAPNEALNSGDIDANSFQHLPYLEAQSKARGYNLAVVGYTYTAPMGFFSKKYKNWKDLPDGATIAIPNDPSNGGRALIALEKNGDIKLREGSGLTPNALDIIENPKNFKFLEMDAASTPRALDEVDVSAVNNTFTLAHNLDLVNGTILREGAADSPYANILVVQEKNKDQPWAKELIKLYQTPETAEFIKKAFKGASFPSWEK